MMPQYTPPADDDARALLKLPLVARGERLTAMSQTRRTAYAVVVARILPADHIAYRRPYRVLDMFASWQQLYLNSLQEYDV